jgi:hypothetical protein
MVFVSWLMPVCKSAISPTRPLDLVGRSSNSSGRWASSSTQIRIDWHPTEGDAINALAKLTQQKQRRGYAVELAP